MAKTFFSDIEKINSQGEERGHIVEVLKVSITIVSHSSQSW